MRIEPIASVAAIFRDRSRQPAESNEKPGVGLARPRPRDAGLNQNARDPGKEGFYV